MLPPIRCLAALLLLAGTALSAAVDPARDFVWQEAEGWVRQQGAGQVRDRWQFLSGRALGGGFGTQVGHFAEYLVELPVAFENACIFVRIRPGGRSAGGAYQLAVDGKAIGQEPAIRLGAPNQWQFARVPVGPLARGTHAIRISLHGDSAPVTIDGFFIAAEAFKPPQADWYQGLTNLLRERSPSWIEFAEQQPPAGGGELGEDYCQYLGGRRDKDLIGSGNLTVRVGRNGCWVKFLDQIWDHGLFDVAAGSVESWYPDHIVLRPTRRGALIERRTVYITPGHLAGAIVELENPTATEAPGELVIRGNMPSTARLVDGEGAMIVTAAASGYHGHTLHAAFGAARRADEVLVEGTVYRLVYRPRVPAGGKVRLSFALGMGLAADRAADVRALLAQNDPLKPNRAAWNAFFADAIPRFRCSDPYYQKLYYYRWWSLATKMMRPGLPDRVCSGPLEGIINFDNLISASGVCLSVTDLRWMRDPTWATETTNTFYHPQNMVDGRLTHHLNLEGPSRYGFASTTVTPYVNYGVYALYQTWLLHPQSARKVAEDRFDQLLGAVHSYDNFFDTDGDGIYEQYPNSVPAATEYLASYYYFNPVAELCLSRPVTEQNKEQRFAELEQQKKQILFSPNFQWPGTPDELLRHYQQRRLHYYETVDQACCGYLDHLAMARICGWLGKSDEAARLHALAERTRRAILEKMWDPDDRFFYDLDTKTDERSKVKVFVGFYPFWAGIARPEHVGALDKLYDPAVFGTRSVPPMLAKDYPFPDFLPKQGNWPWCYWNWPSWPYGVCRLVDAAANAAKTIAPETAPKAADLLRRYTRNAHFVGGTNLNIVCIPEYNDPDQPLAQPHDLDYNHSYYIDLVIRHLVGLEPTEEDAIRLRPLSATAVESFSLENVRYKGRNVSVRWKAGDGYSVELDGQVVARRADLGPLDCRLPTK